MSYYNYLHVVPQHHPSAAVISFFLFFFLSAPGVDHHHSQNPSMSNLMTIHQVTILTFSLDKACNAHTVAI